MNKDVDDKGSSKYIHKYDAQVSNDIWKVKKKICER